MSGSGKMLYRKLVNLVVPDRVQFVSGESVHAYNVIPEQVLVAAFVRWPSGKPCLPVNMYLLDNSINFTGDSVVTTASKLSALVRYCSSGRADGRSCSFADLNDDDIFHIVKKLKTVIAGVPVNKTPNNNTVRAILQACFKFLFWYQDNLHFSFAKLIGEHATAPAIRVTKKTNTHNGRTYWDHRYLPIRESTDPKMPISTKMIEDIEEVVDDLYVSNTYSEPAVRRFGGDVVYFEKHRRYLTARRDFMLLLMRKTGLRPGEMILMSLADNLKSIKSSMLVLPTLKRRKLNPPLRNFPISADVVTRVGIYFEERQAWVEFCQHHARGFRESSSMFLGAEIGKAGAGVTKAGLDKDFRKLCSLAGYRDQQTCFSMFRHRFITDLVILHLKELSKGGSELSKQDYRMVLEKVRERTGHKSIRSLWSYINLALDMDGVWIPVEEAAARLDKSEKLKYDLSDLRRSLIQGSAQSLTNTEVVDLVSCRLAEIIRVNR